MRTVWKFQIERTFGPQRVEMPPSAKFLPVAKIEGDAVFLWAEVGGDRDVTGRTTRTLQVVPTGGTVTDWAEHIATGFDGEYVWHVYEEVPF